MKSYQNYTAKELQEEHRYLLELYENKKAMGLSLNMARGKPDSEQLALSALLLTCIKGDDSELFENGTDLRNYGLPLGTAAARKLMGSIMGLPADQVIVGGSSSLAMMYDTLARAVTLGMPRSQQPWCMTEKRKFLCPAPGYDRHFAITQQLGFELITIPMLPTGPDMDMVEKLVSEDEDIKGIWCVPTYSNPTGYTFSDETVERIAALKPAAVDFTVMWDNAYLVHHLYPTNAKQAANIFDYAKKYNSEDMIVTFISTSKITFPGAGIAAMGSSSENIKHMAKQMNVQSLGADKLNMLRHTRFLRDSENIAKHMEKHAALLRPKFEMVLSELEKELGGLDIASWTSPKGGYFITFTSMEGCAKRIVQLCSDAGVQLTPAGSTHPYGIDPTDSIIRIAPSGPTAQQLHSACEILCLCTRLAATEKLLCI